MAESAMANANYAARPGEFRICTDQGVQIGGSKFDCLFAIVSESRSKSIEGQPGDLDCISARRDNLQISRTNGGKPIEHLSIKIERAGPDHHGHRDAGQEDDKAAFRKTTAPGFRRIVHGRRALSGITDLGSRNRVRRYARNFEA
jgi:hypothetical protein